jgi:hypothetical protein
MPTLNSYSAAFQNSFTHQYYVFLLETFIYGSEVLTSSHQIHRTMFSQFFFGFVLFRVVNAGGPIFPLDYGTFQGASDGNLTKFLGVPFARPMCVFLPYYDYIF